MATKVSHSESAMLTMLQQTLSVEQKIALGPCSPHIAPQAILSPAPTISSSPAFQPLVKETDMFDAVESWNPDLPTDANAFTFTATTDYPVADFSFLPTPGHTAQVSPSLRGADVFDTPLYNFECSEPFDPSPLMSFPEQTHTVFDETISPPPNESAIALELSPQGGSHSNSGECSTEDVMDYLFDDVKTTDFPTLDESILACHTFNPFSPMPSPDEQWIGRNQQLPQSVASFRKPARPRSEWERRDFEQEIMRGAEDALRKELRSFKRDPCFWEWASMVRSGETLSGSSHKDDSHDNPRAREIRRKVQDGVSRPFPERCLVPYSSGTLC
jgi:hypothetical protein